MKILKRIFWFCYHIWFYILVALATLLFFPFLFVTVSRASWYPAFFRIAQLWSYCILFGMGFFPKIIREQTPDPNKSYVFIANHTSMTDIMLMFVSVKNPFVFVGKKELARIPLFGFFYKRSCILVDRSSESSRKAAFKNAQHRLQSGLSLCIFPEGGVPEPYIVLDNFKNGAFRLAIDHQIPIVPITLADNKRRFPYSFSGGSPGTMRVKIHPFITTKNLDKKATKTLSDQARHVILKQLKAFDSMILP